MQREYTYLYAENSHVKMHSMTSALTKIIFAVCLTINMMVVVSQAVGFPVASNLWKFGRLDNKDGTVTITAVMLDIKNPPPDYNPNAPGGWDDHGYGLDTNAPAQLIFKTPSDEKPKMIYTAGYYRGPIYSTPESWQSLKTNNVTTSNFVSIYSNRKRSKLVAAVDGGFIYISTNYGMSWQITKTPGFYEVPLNIASDGSGMYVQANIVGGANTNAAQWYAVATSSDGSKIVASMSSLNPAPALNIRYSLHDVIIAWPAQFDTFTLEQATDLADGQWKGVTNSVQVFGDENRVVVPLEMGNHFFRLRGF